MDKIREIKSLQSIIRANHDEILNNIYENKPGVRKKYCENLYELEKNLKKILEIDNQKR